jgi:anti-sigma factor RsiW
MNHDPVYRRLREASWRRELTDAEQAELRAYLASHPEARTDWEAEADLNAGLSRLPDAPVPSNFTARVLQAVQRESVAAKGQLPQVTRAGWWRAWMPRAAAALIVVGAGWFGYQHYRAERQAEWAHGLAVVATVEPPLSTEALQDFEAIRRLSLTPAADEELLQLNEELLALTP